MRRAGVGALARTGVARSRCERRLDCLPGTVIEGVVGAAGLPPRDPFLWQIGRSGRLPLGRERLLMAGTGRPARLEPFRLPSEPIALIMLGLGNSTHIGLRVS
jgi:hypothetical protein